MAKCYYLEGENIAPRTTAEAKKLIGKPVTYLQKADIDRSGRGLYFPRYGKIAGVVSKNIAIDTPGNYVIRLSDLVEMVLNEDKDDKDEQQNS